MGRKPGLSAGRIVGRGASVVFPSVTVTPDNCPGDATPFTLLPPPSCSFPLFPIAVSTLPYSLPCSTSVTPPPPSLSYTTTLMLLSSLSCPPLPSSCPACSTSITPSTPLVHTPPPVPFPHHGSHFYLFLNPSPLVTFFSCRSLHIPLRHFPCYVHYA